jgi:stearoyl-CoA desaturase (delta-9 desaturase)
MAASLEIWFGLAGVWQPLLALLLYVLTMLGITVGFHRLLSHRAFQCSSAARAVLVTLGCMAAQGPPIYWVANHRRHHQFSDVPGDPHSPHGAGGHTLPTISGLWHAHAGWTFWHELTNSAYYCRDLLRDPVVAWLNRHYGIIVFLGLAVPACIGLVLERSPHGLFDGLLWGGGVRMFASYHLTNSINSITHAFGYRSFATPECSRNNLWLGLPTLGEAWHNNHHAFPSSAIFGYSWWEIDIGGAAIRALEALGIIWNVRKPSPELLVKRRADAALGHPKAPLE